MFILAKGSAPFLHPSRNARSQNHWPVVTRALEAPWYLLVYDVSCHRGHRVSQTSLVGSDDALVELIAAINRADLRGVGRLDRQHGLGPSWSLRWIEALWTPALGEAREVGSLLLRFESEPLVRDALLRPVGEVAGRRLVYEVDGFGEGAR